MPERQITSSRLNRRVTLLRATVAADGYNEDVATWRAVGTVWAAYTPTSDGERVRGAEIGAVTDARFQVRRSALTEAVTPEWRLRFEGRDYNIGGKKEVDGRVGFEISAQARAE